jgi:hypothetical protein
MTNKREITANIKHLISLGTIKAESYLYLILSKNQVEIDKARLDCCKVSTMPSSNVITEVELTFCIELMPSNQFCELRDLYFVAALRPVYFLFHGCSFTGYILDVEASPINQTVTIIASVELDNIH